MSREIGIKIKQLRKSKGLTQEQLANKINITRSTISNYEIGRRTPHLKDLQTIATLFGVGLDYFGISAQIERGIKMVVYIVEAYTDEALTGKNDNREDFQRMINAITSKEITVDFLLVHKFNRFSRNKYDSAVYKKMLSDNGVKVVSVTQSIDDTPEGELMEGFLEVMDEYYSANLSIEVKKGLKENAIKGHFVGGRVLAGQFAVYHRL